MSTKDITRYLHQPRKHYVAGRLQQGRALLDSDFNEDVRLRETDRQQTLLGLIGAAASPDDGFTLGRILPPGPAVSQVQGLRAGDVLPVRPVLLGGVSTNVHAASIRAGSIYAGGMRFELGQPEMIAFQRDFLQMKPQDLPSLFRAGSPSPYSPRKPRSPQFPEFHNFYYLHAWEQAVTAAEDEEFLERGLGGPDTTVRIRRMRRVEVLAVSPDVDNCQEAWDDAIRRRLEANAVLDRKSGELLSQARLSLVFEPVPETSCEECTPDPPAQYLGSENQALRIMLTGPSTFVWAYDNGAPLYRIKVTGLGESDASELRVTLLSPPRDDEHQPRSHRVIEILPFAALLEGGQGDRPNDPHFQKIAAEVGVFTRVATYDKPDQFSFTLDKSVGLTELRELVHRWDPSHPAAAQLNVGDGKERFFYARFWHVADSTSEIHLRAESTPVGQPLGATGIIPVLSKPGRRGDFWLATLRPSTPERIVPFDLLSSPEGVPPHGPRHFYTPLALLEGNNLTVFRVEDCRTRLRRMNDRGCATYTVGDGVNSVGDYTSISAAIDALPGEGGMIAVGPGLYREQIQITGRRSVVVQGCGEASVLQSPTNPSGPLVEITGSEGISLGGLRVNVGEHLGIRVADSGDIGLSGLALVAGTVAADVFTEAPGAADDALISVSTTDLFSASETLMSTQRRPAIAVSDGAGVTLSKLSFRGAESSLAAPAAPMIDLAQVSGARLRQCELIVHGQVGIHLASTASEILIDGVTVFSGPHGVDGGSVQARSALDIDGSARVTVEHSRFAQADELTEHASIAIQGQEILVDDNVIEGGVSAGGESSRLAWGGIQIRGGSQDVEIRDNQIAFGLGHGITLGSVLWAPSNGGTPRREGVGFRQISLAGGGDSETVVTGVFAAFEEGSVEYRPTSEGELSDIRLISNRVRDFASNGISVLTVVGAGDQLFSVRRSTIEKNTISRNVQRPNEEVATRSDLFEILANPHNGSFVLAALPLGGIVLGEVTSGIDIRDNVVTENGNSDVVPQNGIFILAGDSIVITGNRIADNGARAHADSAAGDEPPIPGIRAGIAVLLAGVTPAGTSLPELEAYFQAPEPPLDAAGVALQVLDNNVRHPEGRALHAVVIGPATIDGNYFASLGNHGADESGELGALGEVIFVMDLGRPWEVHGVELLPSDTSGDNFVTYTTPSRTRNYLTGQGSQNLHSPPNFVGLGGQVTFNNNQVTFDWQLLRLPGVPGSPQLPISYFPVTLLTLDHLSVASNQFALRLTFPFGSDARDFGWSTSPEGLEPIAGHVLAAGATTSVVRNRFSEKVGTTTFSMFSGGELMNLTAYNQSTHVVGAYKWSPQEGDAPYLLDEQNQVLFFAPIGNLTSFADVFRGLFEILWRSTP